ncbi:choice-of-anchor Q domain-containing protein [Thiolapillus sp.]|uniref:choice-of-anchor Q domain-containing protein n=7 Tax=Thiolapillus sp. TaxID=2017437 RepID=UPI0025DB159E|nr:choice-of-anchor Q domain-containing protein [Thiolapillus sp.]
MKSRIIIAGALAFSNPAAAIIVHRVTSMADHGTGTLRAAVSSAASGDRITFAPWLYQKIIRLDSQIMISKRLRIEGDINGDRKPDITLDGQHKTRLLDVTGTGNLSLWAVSLEHGKANEGGAIYNEGTINAQFCRIHENLATDQGGAIYNRGTLTIDSSSARDNFAANEGGMIYNGKMINSDTAKTTLVASTFAWNTAKKRGGVIYNHEGIFGAINSTFANNRAQSRTDWENDKEAKGSVLFAVGGSNKLSDSTLMNNKSAPITDPELNECAFGVGKNRCHGCSCRPDAERKRNNKRRRINNGGTLYSLAGTAPVQIIRTVISESRGRNCGGWGRYTLENSWIDDDSCNGDADYSEPGTSWGDAKLGPLANYGGYTHTYSPLPDSGLIDAAGTVCTVRDQRGAPRKRYPDTHCDIGAVDANASAPPRLRPQSINTTPPAEHNEDIAALNSRIETLQTLATSTQVAVVERDATIATQQADITAKAETIVTLQGQLGTLQGQLSTLQTQLAVAVEGSQEADRLRQQIAKKEAQITRKEEEIAEHSARIAELEAPDDLEVAIGDAGKIEELRLNGNNVLHDSETRVKVGSETFRLGDTLTDPAHARSDGSIVSGGQFQGENGIIYWTITSTVVPRTNFHVSRWEFSSPQAFGNVSIGIYADLDIGQYTGHNGLIVGGTGHPNRLLITDRTNPAEGVALGLRALKNASRMGWVGSPDIYHGRNGDVLDPSILTGAYSGWGQFTPDQAVYPGTHGYGPADIALAVGVALKPSAKLASFETSLVGAPNGHIE